MSFPMAVTQSAIKHHLENLRGTQLTIELLRKHLQGNCDHSETEDYKWEHDNGYGRQTMITGKRCVFCLWVDLWSRGHFIDPAEISS